MELRPDETPLFDLDGVLIDSTAATRRHWLEFATRYGVDENRVLAGIYGRRAIDSVREFLPGAQESQIRTAARAQEQLELQDSDGIVALPGARELLSSLTSSRWAVVTSAPRQLAVVRLRAAGLPIPRVVVAADDVAAGKPDPEPYLTAAERLGAAAHDCVVFEDSPAGIAAGRAAGMRVVALTTTYERPQLRAVANPPDEVIRDLLEVRLTAT